MAASFTNNAQLAPTTPTLTTVAATCLADGSTTISNYDNTLTYTFSPTGPTAGAGGVFSEGENELLFHTPFNWNGTDNIVIEFFYDRSVVPNVDWISFESDATLPNMAMEYSTRNGALTFNGSNQVWNNNLES